MTRLRRSWLVTIVAALLAAGCSQKQPPIVCFPAPPARPQLIYLGNIDQAPIDRSLRPSLRRWLGDAPGFLQTPFARPFGLASSGHRLFICDPPIGSVIIIDYDTQESSSLDELGKPVAVCTDPTGHVYVADARSGRIHVFDKSLKKLPPIIPPAERFRPVALVATSDRLFVADMTGRCVRPYDLATSRWGDPLACSPPSRFPSGLCLLKGRLVLSDALDGRLYISDASHTALQSLDQSNDRLRPKHIASCDGDRLLVTDAALQQLDLLDGRAGRLLRIDDKSILSLPSGICLSPELLDFYRKQLPAGFQSSAIVFVSNQSGPPGIAVFALAAS